jgi:hypothetical protein
MPLEGKIDLKKPELELLLYEDYGPETNVPGKPALRKFFGRIVSCLPHPMDFACAGAWIRDCCSC